MDSDAAAGQGDEDASEDAADWQRRVVGRSLHSAKQRSIDRGARLIRAAANVLERTNGESLTVQDVADEAGQSLRTLYQYFASKDDLLLAVFEEATRTYARMIHAGIVVLEEPVERLAGGLIVSTRLPQLHEKTGVDRGLSYLRLHLTQADPALLVRSQEPLTAVYRELVADALAASPATMGVDEGTYFLASLRASFTASSTLGSDLSVALPDVIDFSCFCLDGLGLHRPRPWHEAVDARIDLLGGDARSILRRE